MYRHYAKKGVYDNIIFSVKTQVKTFNYQSPIKPFTAEKTGANILKLLKKIS
jgi:hypothetical protein